MSPPSSATQPRPDFSRKSSYISLVIRVGSDNTFSVTDKRIRDIAGMSLMVACLKNGRSFACIVQLIKENRSSTVYVKSCRHGKQGFIKPTSTRYKMARNVLHERPTPVQEQHPFP